MSRKEQPAAPEPSRDPDAARGLIVLGPRESAAPLTLLELLRDAHLKHGDNLRAIVIGVPFHRVERTLAAAGFDTAQHLHTLGAGRRWLNLEDADTGTRWTLAESELGKTAKPELRVGRRVPIAPEYRFVDWIPATQAGHLRHRLTGRELPRPAHLVYTGSTDIDQAGSYDGIHERLDPEALFARLRDFGQLGLNAQSFFRDVITVIGHTRERFTSELFCELITRTETLMTEVEYLVAHLDNLPESEQRHVSEAIGRLMSLRDGIPAMAVRLAADLRAEIASKRTPYALGDFLTPGLVWHVPTETHAEKQFAAWLKADLQRRLLDMTPDAGVTLLMVENWTELVSPETDRACLGRHDILQVYGLPRPDHFLEKTGVAGLALIRDFHCRLWHSTSRDADTNLLLDVHPDSDYTRQTLPFLHWERRLRDAGSGTKLQEAPIALNVDGMENIERARRAMLRPHHH